MQHSLEDAVKLDLLPNLRTAMQRDIVLSAVLQIVYKTTGPDIQFTNRQCLARNQFVDLEFEIVARDGNIARK
jgi:hypothetical protein